MNGANKLNAYRVNAVSTASAENLVVMLYDGAIRFLGTAIRAFENDDPLDFNLTVHNNITKTQAIIRELSHSLDVEKAGELGHSLISLYDYFDTRLQEANIRKDKAILEEIIERVGELRDAWSESFNTINEGAQSGAHASTQIYAPNTDTPPAPAPSPSPTPDERPSFSITG
jgi:flagellar protein FliS|tara:strand:- start:898 stop:1413 length:516 start_codon:yes stop_codon:yes gene_type:complete